MPQLNVLYKYNITIEKLPLLAIQGRACRAAYSAGLLDCVTAVEQDCQRDFFVSPIICQNFPPKSNKFPIIIKTVAYLSKVPPGRIFLVPTPACQQFFHATFLPPHSSNFLQVKKQILQAYFQFILQLKRHLIFPHFSQVPPIQHRFSSKKIPHRCHGGEKAA